MEEYVLVKEYPGSPKLNSIIKKDNHFGYFGFVVNQIPLYPEHYPEFWELVVKKDYEILSFVTSENLLCIKGSNERFDVKYQMYRPTEGDCLKAPGFNIHSIKRLSDGEVFTIGDKLETKYNLVINEFEIISNELKIWCVNPAFSCHIKPKSNGSITCCGNMSFYYLKSIQHFKQPLFKTEDGIDIFEGDKFYYVKYKTNRRSLGDLFEIITADCPGCRYEPEFDKYFSTKEKAKEYIIKNKPCLSLNDIINNFSYDKSLKKALELNKHQFTELVKSKLITNK